ncbi:6-deoxyerythronolide-B synthase [Venturia nashicola]|nr:6-deoxyerythronolide-B synthase [Venturia nashicola]
MEPCHLFVLGDQTIAFEASLQQLLHVKGNGYLNVFFEKIAFTLREEISGLPSHQQDLFPRFTTIVDLVHDLGSTKGTPALKFPLLCVYEIGQFIKYFGEGSRLYPAAGNSYLIGLCTGSYAAAAISTSRTVSELIPAGVEAVLVAFRTALHSLTTRNEIEQPVPESNASWSAVVSLKEKRAIELLAAFGQEHSLPKTSKPYLSAVSPTSVTISGPPTVLRSFLEASSLKPYYLPIETPYHAKHLFSTSDVDQIVGTFHDGVLQSYSTRIPLLSASNGKQFSATSYRSLLSSIVSDTLCELVRLDIVLQSCVDDILHELTPKRLSIFPVSSNAAQVFASKFSGSKQVEVSVNDMFNIDILGTQPALPSGKFQDSKIAIIGFSGRYPDSASNEEFWDLIHNGRDVHREIPPDRFDWKAHFDPTGKKKNTSRVKYGCFIKEPGMFDARFFNLSPRESENTDPAQRLAITATYEAIEMAGLVPNRTPSTRSDRIGVFFGVTSDDWREVNSGQNIDTYFIPGGNRAFIPGRISYFFRFSGPSISFDTACSSSFAAIQSACSYLWRGDCDTAVAGGTNVLTNPDNFAGLDRGHFLSTTGNCNAFDDGASGYCRADAVGSVILKRLEDAENDDDPIFGVIAGTYTNHCGQTVSITRPHSGDQEAVFKKIIRHANVNPLALSYVEMHGTGTQAGDGCEMGSVLNTFSVGLNREPQYPLHIGSVKANIGHAESASGVSSLIKVLMMMQHDEIPPHCGIKTKINHTYPLDLAERNVHIALKATPWFRENTLNGKRTAFLNNFSAAGGNTAVLLEDAPLPRAEIEETDPRTSHIITVTAKTSKSLKGNIDALMLYLEKHPETSLPRLSYTTTARRMQHNYRTIFSASEMKDLHEALEDRLSGADIRPIPVVSKIPKISFVFTGQGSLYISMGKQLYDSSPYFKVEVLRFNSIAQRQGFSSFLPLIDGSASEEQLLDPTISHLGLTCLQMALTCLWASWGVFPSSVTGHSLGEYAALHAAGVLSANDTIFLVGTRAKLLSTHCSRGTHSMVAIKGSLDSIKPYIPGSTCEPTCINSPSATVVSGTIQDVDSFTTKCKAGGLECFPLEIPYAFHSAQVNPILEPFEVAARDVRFNIPTVPYFSPLLGKVVSDGQDIDARYLVRACRHAVNFQAAIEAANSSLIVDAQTLWLELGAHSACSGMIKSTLGSQVITMASLRKGVDAWKVITGVLGTLYTSGIDINWNEYHRGFRSCHKLLPLPRYCWDLKNYWIMYKNNFCLTKGDDPLSTLGAIAPTQIEQRPAPVYISPSVQRVLDQDMSSEISTLLIESDINDPRLSPVLQGHKVNGVALCPSSLYADMAMCMADYMLKAKGIATDGTGLDVCKMKVEKPLISNPANGLQLLRVSASVNWSMGVLSLAFYSMDAQGKKIADHAACQVHITEKQQWSEEWKRNSYLIRSRVDSLRKGVEDGDSHLLKKGIVYKLFSSLVEYDSTYQGMQEVVLDSGQLEATAKVTFQVDDEGFYFNPRWVDSLGHIAGFIMNGNDHISSKSQVFVNHGWSRMRCATKFVRSKTYTTYNRMQLVGTTTLYSGDTYILDGDQIVAIFEGVQFQGVPRQVLDQLLPSKNGGVATAARPALPTKTLPDSQATSVPIAAIKPTVQPTKATTVPAKKPSDAPSKVLLSITSEEAGIDLKDLDPSADFADHGVDSLLSLNITGRLKEELGLDLPSSVFVDYPTVKELAAFVDADTASASSSRSSSFEKVDLELESASEDDLTGYETSASSVDEEFDVMNIVREIIATETRCDLADITDSSSFAELGVDSLLALNITGRLSELLDGNFSSNLLSDNDTLAELRCAIGLKPKTPAKGPTASGRALNSRGEVVSSAPHATSVPLQGNPRTASKILFLFPDGSGSATSYASIPTISSSIAIYGLNCPWLKNPWDMKASLEQQSAKYLTEIRRRQPQGPYYFGGWSAGGICAYEACQQLARNGEETAKLILIDTPNPVGLENPPQRMYDFFESLDLFGTKGKAPPKWLRPHFDAFINSLDNYKVKPFRGPSLPTHIIYAKDGICKNPEDPRPEIRDDDPREMLWLLNSRTDFTAGGWASLVGTQNVKVEVLEEVNHFSMVAPGPKIKELSGFIERAME